MRWKYIFPGGGGSKSGYFPNLPLPSARSGIRSDHLCRSQFLQTSQLKSAEMIKIIIYFGGMQELMRDPKRGGKAKIIFVTDLIFKQKY